MIVAGIGCRTGTTALEIDAAIDAALAEAGQAPEALSCIATSDGKSTAAPYLVPTDGSFGSTTASTGRPKSPSKSIGPAVFAFFR